MSSQALRLRYHSTVLTVSSGAPPGGPSSPIGTREPGVGILRVGKRLDGAELDGNLCVKRGVRYRDLERRTASLPAYGWTEGSDVRDTVQAKLVQLGLLQPNMGGASWELTQEARELLLSTLTSPHKSNLAADLLKLGMIEPGAMGSGPWWVFTSRGRDLMTYLLNNPVPIEEPESDSNTGPVE
jgi:hypothetical protein